MKNIKCKLSTHIGSLVKLLISSTSPDPQVALECESKLQYTWYTETTGVPSVGTGLVVSKHIGKQLGKSNIRT